MSDDDILERATTVSKLFSNYEEHQSFDTPIKLIELQGDQAGGKFAIVDAEFYPLLSRHTWYLRPSGVAKSVGASGEKLFMHRLIFGNSRQAVFHKNGNHLDNRLANLEEKPSNLLPIVEKNTSPCILRGCERIYYAKGLCKSHYQKEWRKSLIP